MAENTEKGNDDILKDLISKAEKVLGTAEVNSNKIADILKQMNDLVAKASEAQKKADDEALRAFNAKNQIEEHVKSVSSLRAEADGHLASISSKIPALDALAQNLTNLNKASESDVQEIKNIRKTAVETNGSIIEADAKVKSALSSIEENKKATDKFNLEIKDLFSKSKLESDEVSSFKKVVEGLANNVKASESAANDLEIKITKSLETIVGLETKSKNTHEAMSALFKDSETSEERIKKYEEILNNLEKDFGEIHLKIETLLPGATSTSLAYSFNDAKNRFKIPQVLWLAGFLTCVGVLIWLGFDVSKSVEFLPGGSNPTWDDILRQLVQRLPYVIPLVWFGVYSVRQHTLALRMEEEYAFKATTSMAFEGYKREMKDIGEPGDGSERPIITLCKNILGVLYRRPGLIYEGKQKDITPLSPALDALEKVSEGLMGLSKINDVKESSLVKSVVAKIIPVSKE